MKKRIISLIILLLSVFCLFPMQTLAQEQFPFVKTVYNEQNGLPTGEANDVLQTADGYIWVASYGGLIRYDGREFRNYSTDGSLSSSSVRSLFEDSKGRLWIGTNDAGVFYMENDEIKQPDGQPQKSFLCVLGFAEDFGGTVYACSSTGIAQIDDNVMSVYIDPEVTGKYFYTIAADKYGRVWGADGNGRCIIISKGKTVHITDGEYFFGKNQSFYSLTSGVDGEVWLGSAKNKLAKVELKGEGFSQEDMSVTLYDTGSVRTHNNLRMMKDGTLAVSGLIGFGTLSPDGKFTSFSEKDGAVSVNNAFIDYEGSIWLASTNYGIIKYSVGCFYTPNAQADLEGLTLNTVTCSGDNFYIGYDSGLIICDKTWHRQENELTKKFKGVRIRCIIADKKGRIWIASYSETPVVCYEPESKKITSYSVADGIAGTRARVLLELSDGSVAVGAQGGLNVIHPNGKIELYDQMEYASVLCILEGEDGALLAGSDGGGIYEIKDGAITSHDFSDGLTEGVVLRMMDDTEGSGRFVSAGSSLYYWEDGKFRKLDSLQKGAGSIFDFYQDGNTLWLLQNSGVVNIDRAHLLSGGSGNPITYSFHSGLTGSLNANTWSYLDNGKLYLATRNGISVFGFTVPPTKLPKAVINSVTVDDKIYEHPTEVQIDKNAQRITMDFAALSYVDPSHYNLSYKLDGFDGEEIAVDSTTRRSISYTNLAGGHYTFKLKIASHEDMTVYNVYTFKITKQKRLVEMPLFWVLLVLLPLGAVAGVLWIISEAKLRNSQKRQREYQDILEQSLLTFAGAIDAKDKYTNGHSYRVALYSRELAGRMGFSEQERENIYYVALLHDIGKIGVRDSILNKPGSLTEEERNAIRQHPMIGARILKNFTALKGISDGAKYHHERYDGTGYCEHKSGEDIPVVARIISVADTYDAMSSERCYRKPLERDKIVSELKRVSGSQLDPDIVSHMLDMINENAVPQSDENDPFSDKD